MSRRHESRLASVAALATPCASLASSTHVSPRAGVTCSPRLPCSCRCMQDHRLRSTCQASRRPRPRILQRHARTLEACSGLERSPPDAAHRHSKEVQQRPPKPRGRNRPHLARGVSHAPARPAHPRSLPPRAPSHPPQGNRNGSGRRIYNEARLEGKARETREQETSERGVRQGMNEARKGRAGTRGA